MPAWITSELREEVAVPMPSAASRTSVSRPERANAAATASPTAPAPMTTTSVSINPRPLTAVPYPARLPKQDRRPVVNDQPRLQRLERPFRDDYVFKGPARALR